VERGCLIASARTSAHPVVYTLKTFVSIADVRTKFSHGATNFRVNVFCITSSMNYANKNKRRVQQIRLEIQSPVLSLITLMVTFNIGSRQVAGCDFWYRLTDKKNNMARRLS
jgi:hypothetical protein